MKNKIRTSLNVLVIAALAFCLLSAPAERVKAAPSSVFVGQICTVRSGNSISSKLDGVDSTYHAEIFVGRDTRTTIIDEIPVDGGRYLFNVRLEAPGFVLDGWVRSQQCKTIAPA